MNTVTKEKLTADYCDITNSWNTSNINHYDTSVVTYSYGTGFEVVQ